MQEVLDGGPQVWRQIENSSRSSRVSGKFRLKDVKLLAPLPRPRKILLAIVNTQGMLGGEDVTLDHPRFDMKAPSAVVGPEDTVWAPPSGIRPEVELAGVVGKTLRKANAEEAKGGIFGYTIFNDITAPKDSKDDAYEAYRTDPTTKELKKATLRGPLFRSKNHDTFGPMGPLLVTPDEIRTDSLRMTTKFNGELVQSGSTSEYIFTPEEMAAYVSQFLTLEPGDVVSCGSVGWEKKLLGGTDPSQWVLPTIKGLLELEIEGIGVLRNPVRAE